MVLEPFKLPKEKKKLLLDLSNDIEAFKIEIQRAKRAGLDVTELNERFTKSVALRDGLLREYG